MEDEEFGNLNTHMDIDTNLNPKEYVNRVIRYAEGLFKEDRGRSDTKRANLGDIKSTQITTPEIIQKLIYSCATDEEKAHTYVTGNIKAIIPLFRERLTCDEASSTNVNLVKFKRGPIIPICEKRIFGILTAD